MTSNKTFVPGKGTLIAILIASMTIAMGGAAVAPALPSIQQAFPDAGEMMISMVISLPSLGVAVAGFPMGMLADRWGKARTLALSAFIFIVAGVSAMFLDDISIILAGRFVLGVGIAGITLCTTALISEYWHGSDTTRILGLQSAAIGAGIICLETGGGALADIGWREPFIVYAIIGLPILILTLLFVRDLPRDGTVVGSEKDGERSGRMTTVIIMALLLIFVIEIAFFMFPSKIAYYILEIDPMAPSVISGLFLGFAGLANAISSLITPKLSVRMSRAGLFALVGTLFLASGLLMFAQVDFVTTCIAMVLAGCGIGIVIPTIVGWLATISVKSNSGKIMGLYSVVMNLGMFVATFAMLPIAEVAGGYNGMYLVGAVLVFILSMVYFGLRRKVNA